MPFEKHSKEATHCQPVEWHHLCGRIKAQIGTQDDIASSIPFCHKNPISRCVGHYECTAVVFSNIWLLSILVQNLSLFAGNTVSLKLTILSWYCSSTEKDPTLKGKRQTEQGKKNQTHSSQTHYAIVDILHPDACNLIVHLHNKLAQWNHEVVQVI